MLAAWVYAMFCSMIMVGTLSDLLKEIRKVDAEDFDYIHEGGINSSLGAIPYVTVNLERLAEVLDQKAYVGLVQFENAKAMYQKAYGRARLGLAIFLLLLALGFIVLMIIFALAAFGMQPLLTSP